MASPTRIPLPSLVFGYGPALVIPLLGVAAWLATPGEVAPMLWAGRLWAGAILVFLAGVRRGLSFFTDGGPRAAQILTMMALFVLGLLGLALPLVPGLVTLAIGYAAIALLDPPAARRGEAPNHFAALRPPQMAVALVGLVLLFARAVHA